MSHRTALLTIITAGSVTAQVGAQVPLYSNFAIQARSNIGDGFNLPALSSFNSKTPALNDGAIIAFTLVTVGGGNAGLFVGSEGFGAVVYDALPDRGLSDASQNTAGFVAMGQSDLFSDGIYVYDPSDGMTVQGIALTTFNLTSGVEINDGGGIGFRGRFSGGPNSWRFVESGGASTTYASEGSGGISFLFTPSTNNLDQIGGKVRLNNNNNDAPDEIRVYDGMNSFTIVVSDVDADAGSPFSGFDNSIDLANDGRVAFIANTTGGDRGVYLTDGATTVTIATEADAEVSDISFFPPAVNDNGLVVFRGADAAGLDAVFVGDGVMLRRVIGEHDLVEIDLGTARIDQNDNSVTFGGAVAINNHGDLAFNAALTPEDNDQIEWGSGMFIAYATPTDIPTLSAWGVAGLATLLALTATIIIHRRATT